MNLVQTKLEQLAKLPENWDSYGALPTTPVALAAADLLLNLLIFFNIFGAQIVPTVDGGIQLEWYTKEYEVEVVINSKGQLEDVWGEYRDE